MKLSISFLSIQNETEKILKLNNTKCDYIHYDIMDGIFTENKTISDDIIKSLELNKPKDIHLMVEDVKKYVDIYKDLKPEYITFHVEANVDTISMINYIHSLGIKVGISINPDTDITQIEDYLPLVDLVLVMSVKPGKGGQKFIDIEEKIKALKSKNYNYVIEVDGGINNETIKKCKGADIIVVGSYITSGNFDERIESLWRE